MGLVHTHSDRIVIVCELVVTTLVLKQTGRDIGDKIQMIIFRHSLGYVGRI